MRKSTRAMGALLGAAVLAVSPVPAAAQSYSASRVISYFSPDDLRAVLGELDATMEQSSDEEDRYLIKFSNGTASSVFFRVCSSSGCRGLNFLASFAKPSDKTSEATSKLVHDYNETWSAAKAYPKSDGGAYVQHYVISDGGITMDNLRAQVNIYSSMLQKMRETIYTDG
ncbi:YbjN domain-containing protein [Qipengyuania flava]|uniref:YbjN domain-containing protein n=1 Tax=Qipengyuania flava TaxID=192812 RepID=UPI001C635B66|nr:YbjN domain-containing protein [Qipengyuania flava]QYJ06206.1 YbjN domain-containing protein [Qipengyuania flava]